MDSTTLLKEKKEEEERVKCIASSTAMTPMLPLRMNDSAYLSYIDLISRLSSRDVTIFTKLNVTNKR